ncbi:MAG TPA: YcxB family protein [Herpetosiphonaceae bacterium]
MDSDTTLFSGRFSWRRSDGFEAARVNYRRRLIPKLMNGLTGLIFGGLILFVIFSTQSSSLLKLAGMALMVPILAASMSDRFWPMLGFDLGPAAEPTDVALTAGALKLRERGQVLSSPWSGYASVAETPDSFVLFIDKKQHMVLPKRAFAPAQILPLRLFLRERFGAAAELMES